MKIPKIGMRNIKTAASVFLCLVIYELINREDPLLACAASIICTKPDVDNSLKAGMSRLIGTTIGGVVSVIVLLMIEASIVDQMYLIMIPLGIVVLIEICVILDKKDSVTICCIVYLSIMLTKRFESVFVVYAFNRIIDTAIGILIALFVNRYLMIPKKVKELYRRRILRKENLDDEEIMIEEVCGADGVNKTDIDAEK
jgi:uncharacterized membrane protein YgaE (UPF0421/DUF939 family)